MLPIETLRALAQLSVEQIEAVTVFTRFLSQEGLDKAQWSQIIERFPEHVQYLVAAAVDAPRSITAQTKLSGTRGA